MKYKSHLGIFFALSLTLSCGTLPALENASDLNVRAEETLQNLEDGAPITTIGWTGANAVNILGATARIDHEQKVMQVSGATRQSAESPLQTVAPPFAEGDILFFSALMKRTGSGSSGIRIRVTSADHLTAGGFGVSDSLVESVGGRFALLEKGNNWKFGESAATANTWYEVVLVLVANQGKTLATLYVRNITAREGNFEPVDGLRDVEVSLETSGKNFSHWRVENFRADAQVSSLRAGVVQASH